VAGCQEQLTAPGSCPATCPGGTPVLRDTVLDALVDQDSLFSGYLIRGATLAGVRLSNGLDGHTDYGVIGFVARPDTVPTRDTADPYTTYVIDSVAITVTLLARDTSASGIQLELHRLPATTDTTATFGDIDPIIVPGTLIDSVTIADSVRPSFTYRFLFQGDTLALVDIPAADSGVFAMAVAISGGSATGVRLGGIGSGTGVPLMRTYVTANTTDTTPSVKHQVVQTRPRFTTFVSSAPAPAYDPTVLSVGTAIGTRAYIRFPWPAYLKDTALLARATLELVPEVPFNGLPGDSTFLNIHGVRLDFGAKSPVINPFGGTRFLPVGSADTLRIDVVTIVQAWQRDQLPLPPLLVAIVDPEGAAFTEPRFYSTRSPVPARRPRLRITYQLPFDFERP
ncbi:MAG TPA: hypothetical protein VG940_00310, partial [Gemmatimonadales bacterium]|nr:hypothetical protein [Gemmatimonadales bacterium]